MLECRNKRWGHSDGNKFCANHSTQGHMNTKKPGPTEEEKEEKYVRYWSSAYGVRTANQHRDPGMFLRRYQNKTFS